MTCRTQRDRGQDEGQVRTSTENIISPEGHLRRVERVSAAELEEELELLALVQSSRSTLHIYKPPGEKMQTNHRQEPLNTLITPVCIKHP